MKEGIVLKTPKLFVQTFKEYFRPEKETRGRNREREIETKRGIYSREWTTFN
jgi:hypothetical protein